MKRGFMFGVSLCVIGVLGSGCGGKLTGLSADAHFFSAMMQNGGDQRLIQAKVLWDVGWGQVLGHKTFQSYLETIPPPPGFLAEEEAEFPMLVLVDARLPLVTACRLTAVACPEEVTKYGERLAPLPSSTTTIEWRLRTGGVYWIRVNLEPKTAGASALEVAQRLSHDGLSAFEGIALFAQDRTVIQDRFLNLAGGLVGRERIACLGFQRGLPNLRWNNSNYPAPHFVTPLRIDR
jgi:hypothetical protein